MKNIKQGENDVLEIQNKNVRGLNILGVLTGAANNVAIGAAGGFDYSKVDINITLERFNSTFTIYNGDLLPLLLHSNFKLGEWDYNYPLTTAEKHLTTRAEDTSVKETAVQLGTIDFGGVYNLQGNDKLKVYVSIDGDAVDSDTDSSVSYLSLDYFEAEGLEVATPVFDLKAINAAENSINESLGSDVYQVTFINYDKQSILTADKVVKNYTINSSDFDISMDYTEMLAMRNKSFEDISKSITRNQCFLLYDGMMIQDDIDNAHLNASLESGNVLVGQNWMVTQRFLTGSELIERAHKRQSQKTAKSSGKARKSFRR